jgi:hypothetical protein
MADYSLQSGRDAGRSLLLVHCRCALSPGPRSCLSIQILRLIVLARLLRRHHAHLLPVRRRSLCGVWWRSAAMIWTVHVVVVVHVRLRMRTLRSVLAHLQVSICRMLSSLSLLGCHGLLLRLLALSAHALKPLLFLHSWCWRTAGARLQRHGWHKRAGELRLCDEGMQLRLSRRPTLERIEVKETLREIDKCRAVC